MAEGTPKLAPEIDSRGKERVAVDGVAAVTAAGDTAFTIGRSYVNRIAFDACAATERTTAASLDAAVGRGGVKHASDC